MYYASIKSQLTQDNEKRGEIVNARNKAFDDQAELLTIEETMIRLSMGRGKTKQLAIASGALIEMGNRFKRINYPVLKSYIVKKYTIKA